MHPATTLAALLAVIAIASGCASPEQTEEPEVHLPLDHDPTDEIVLGEWWSDGARLLRLERDGSYALYDSTNRYRSPAEVGRWDRSSYAVLWLQPYDELDTRRVRVAIDRLDDGELGLIPPGQAVLLPIDGPPAVVEDRLIGAWVGGAGRLLLREDGRYWFDPSRQGGRPVGRAGHIGRWRVEGEVLHLAPEAQVVAEWTLQVVTDAEAIRLEGDGAEYRPG
ncbi:MAG: hypothetical protein ACYTJ0_15500 [Planctomycetota bacterium]|jgi:hypothetical protein